LNDEQNSAGLKQEVIEVISYPLRDGGYTVHFFLERHGRDILVTHFESEQRFDTDEEALSAGVNLGQHQIDIVTNPRLQSSSTDERERLSIVYI
jgi:hypothetical protein